MLKLHARLIKATGGSDGIRDEGMLDGNKRLGTHVMLVFLALNGYELDIYQNIEPFWTLGYAADPLSWGDEGQVKNIYERMLGYYGD